VEYLEAQILAAMSGVANNALSRYFPSLQKRTEHGGEVEVKCAWAMSLVRAMPRSEWVMLNIAHI